MNAHTILSPQGFSLTPEAYKLDDPPRVLALEADGATVLAPALIVEPWDAETKDQLARMARALIRGDEYHAIHARGQGEHSALEIEHCGTCAVLGLNGNGDLEHNPEVDGPNYAGWPRVWVQARRRIPSRWRPIVERHLADDYDNPSYRDALRRDVATFGIRFE